MSIMATKKRGPAEANTVFVFPSELGWMGVVVTGKAVRQLTFGHDSAAAAKKALDHQLVENAKMSKANSALVGRLKKYASGCPVSFADVAIDPGPMGEFQRRVMDECRRIPYGKTLSYGELAAKAGSPRAARAVGNCMAGNRIPLLVPCHRVVRSGGGLGSFSAPGGVGMKRRILAMESHEA
jgi:methylated-DNA-[protein]-cysteine S-methyltransferase